jgi:hypothetical protein
MASNSTSVSANRSQIISPYKISAKGAKKSEQFLTAEAQNTRIPFCNS